MSIQDELLSSIELMIKKAIHNISPCKTISANVIKCENGLYQVYINGTEYWVKDCVGCAPTRGETVWVHIPERTSDAFIIGKK